MPRTMLTRAVATSCFALFATSASAQTGALEDPPERIVVVGQKPGPGLWKVSKDDHVLWVFGTYEPLPSRLDWRSQQVEAIVAQSQEFLSEPEAKADIGVLRALTLLPFLYGARDNPNGAKLRDLVPPDIHERWLVLKARYIGEDKGIESHRPLFASKTLFDKAMERNGMSKRALVGERIGEIVKRHKLKVTPSVISLPFDSAVSSLREFKKTVVNDVPCFTKTIERLETDLGAMRTRAQAWAKGDIARIRELDYRDQDIACSESMLESDPARNLALEGIEPRMRTLWLEHAEQALAANRSTFAVLPIKNILPEDGYLAALAARGYAVEQPE